MALNLKTIKALTFDIGGTIFDWHHTIRNEIDQLATARQVEINPGDFANAWRVRMFERLALVRSGELPWQNADHLHRSALDDIAGNFSALSLTSADCDELNQVWHRLAAWPDAPQALEQLRHRYIVVVLTVLSWAIAVDCSKVNGMSWDGILSCEFLGHYKPDAEAYQTGVRLLGLTSDEVMMVAAHPRDLWAAAEAGLRTAYVPRPLERGADNPPEPPHESEFDIHAADFADLVKQLVT